MKIGEFFPQLGTHIRGITLPGSPGKGLSAVGELGLTVGQLFKARIAATSPDGKVLLDIGGRLVAAQSETIFEQGREFWLEVRQTGVTPWFALAGRKGAAQELIKQLLTDPRALSSMFEEISKLAVDGTPALAGGNLAAIERFFTLFAKNSLAEAASPEKLIRTMLWLKGPVEAGQGGGGNSLVEDLKSLLAILSQKDEEARLFSPSFSKNSFEHLARLADSMQTLNLELAAAGQSFANIFPCFFAQGAGWGEWLISVDQDKGSEKRNQAKRIRIDFFLHMSRLGDIHVRAVLVETELLIEFLLADEHVYEYLRSLLPELTACLSGVDVTAGVSCNLMAANFPHGMRKTILERLGLQSPFSIINITA